MSNDALTPTDAEVSDFSGSSGSSESRVFTLNGHAGDLVGRSWSPAHAQWIAVLCHGYGEHVGRYEGAARTLNDAGAAVYGADHVGHGRSNGQRALIPDYEPVVTDLHRVVEHAREQHPGLPVVLIGHSMGGMIAARYTQRYGGGLAATVLSGPVLGSWHVVDDLLPLEEIPSTPIDPATLSRDAAVGEAYAADELVWHGDFKRPTLRGMHEAMATIDAAGSIGDIPLLHLHGEDDQLVPPAPSLDGLQRLRGSATEVVTYPGARHEIFLETNRDQVLADVVAFVHRVLARRG